MTISHKKLEDTKQEGFFRFLHRMKVHFALPLALLTSVILVGFIKIRKKDHEKEEKRTRFQEIKLRVTSDVLQEYHNEQIEKQEQVEKAQKDLNALEDEVKVLRDKTEKATGDLGGCDGSQVIIVW